MAGIMLWFSFFSGGRGIFLCFEEYLNVTRFAACVSVCICLVCVCVCGGGMSRGEVALLACQAIYNFVWLRLKHMGSTAVVNMQIWNKRRLPDLDVPLYC